jgi:hypothetical protein
MELTKEQEQALMEADILEELSTTKGWTWITAFISNKIQQFTNRAILDGFKNQEDYQFYRGEVAGLRSLLVEVENSLLNLKNYRDKQRETGTAK